MGWKCQWGRLGFKVLYICDLEHSDSLSLWCLIYYNKGNNNNVFIIITENVGNIYLNIWMLLNAINAEEFFIVVLYFIVYYIF